MFINVHEKYLSKLHHLNINENHHNDDSEVIMMDNMTTRPGKNKVNKIGENLPGERKKGDFGMGKRLGAKSTPSWNNKYQLQNLERYFGKEKCNQNA